MPAKRPDNIVWHLPNAPKTDPFLPLDIAEDNPFTRALPLTDDLMWANVSSKSGKVAALNEALGLDDQVRAGLISYFKSGDETLLGNVYPNTADRAVWDGLEMYALIDTKGTPQVVIVTYTKKDGTRDMMHCLPCATALSSGAIKQYVTDLAAYDHFNIDADGLEHTIRVNEVARGHIKTDLEARDAAESFNTNGLSKQMMATINRVLTMEPVTVTQSPEGLRKISLQDPNVTKELLEAYGYKNIPAINDDGTMKPENLEFLGRYFFDTPDELQTYALKDNYNRTYATLICDGNNVLEVLGVGREANIIRASKDSAGKLYLPHITGYARDRHGKLHNLSNLQDGDVFDGDLNLREYPRPLDFKNSFKVIGNLNLEGCAFRTQLSRTVLDVTGSINLQNAKGVVYGARLRTDFANMIGAPAPQEDHCLCITHNLLKDASWPISRMSRVGHNWWDAGIILTRDKERNRMRYDRSIHSANNRCENSSQQMPDKHSGVGQTNLTNYLTRLAV